VLLAASRVADREAARMLKQYRLMPPVLNMRTNQGDISFFSDSVFFQKGFVAVSSSLIGHGTSVANKLPEIELLQAVGKSSSNVFM